jgi:xanthosine utilization system XapX-like protein
VTAIGLDRTAFDDEFVVETLEDEDSYAGLTEEFQSEVSENLSQAVGEGLPPGITIANFDANRTAAESITESYIEAEFGDAVTGLYAFVHGETETLVMEIDLAQVRERLQGAFETDQVAVDTPVFVAELAPADTPLPTDTETVAALSESQESYEAVRQQLRVDVAFRGVRREDPDRLLDAVIDNYDPEEYTAEEKQQEIDAHEDAIRSYLESELQTDEQLAARVGQRLEEIGEQTRTDIEREVRSIDQPSSVTNAGANLGTTVVDGLISDMTYTEYTTQLENSEETLQTAVAAAIDSEIESSVPENLDLAEGLGGEDGDDLDAVVLVFSLGGLAVWVLPLATIVLVGVVYWLTRDPHRTAAATGKTFATVGAFGVLVGYVVNPLLRSFLEGQAAPEGDTEPSGLAQGGLAVVDGTLSQIGLIAALVLVFGLVLFGLVAADRCRKLDGVRDALGLRSYVKQRGETDTAAAGDDGESDTDATSSSSEADAQSAETGDESDTDEQ